MTHGTKKLLFSTRTSRRRRLGLCPVVFGLVAVSALLLGAVTARGITLVEGGHTLILIADSVTPLDPSQVILGTNNGVLVAPTGIESITVDDTTGLIYVQVANSPFVCPSQSTAIYQISPLFGVTVVINPVTGFGICARGSDIDLVQNAAGAPILVAENEFGMLGGSEIATVGIPGGALGTWVTPSVFAGNSFGMQFAPGVGVVPAGDIVYVADLGGDLNSAPFGGPNVLRAVTPGGGDDMYIQPDGDIVFVGDFAVGIHVYDPTTFVSTPAALPDVATMFANDGLLFDCGTRATVCPDTGEGLISFSCNMGGTGVYRLNEPLTASNLVLTMAKDEGIQDLTVGPAGSGNGTLSLYMTVENWTTGAHQVWEVTDICGAAATKVSKWTQLPHDNGLGFDAPSNLWWNKNPPPAGQTVLADDFFTDGQAGLVCNEICSVSWHGSYVDPNFPVGSLDGFIVSFFTDLPATPDAPSRPRDLIVSYFVDLFEEFVEPNCPPGCDGHPVWGYNADLRSACIIANPMGIAVQNECLITPTPGEIWWISIEPVLGFTYTKDPANFCVQMKTNNSWPNAFWGWHTTFPTTNFNDDAFVGTLSISPAPNKVLTYNWVRDLHWFDVATPACQPMFPPFDGNTSANLSFDLHNINFALCWNQPPCDPNVLPVDPAAANVDVPTGYQWSGGDVAGNPVNVVVADDFISDGRPITGVRWWGSYFDPRYEPGACVSPPAGMVAWWPLDELAGGIAADLIGGNDGTHINSPTPLAGEFVDNSLCFSTVAAPQYVEVPDAPALNFGVGDLSIDAWVRTSNANGVQAIVDKRENPLSGVVGYELFLSNGQLGFQLADGNGSNTCACTAVAACTNYVSGVAGFVADGVWHHVAVTVNRAVAGGGTFYVDGVAVGNFDPTCRTGSLSNASPLRIGFSTITAAKPFIGCIDEVELFNLELPAADVAAIFSAGPFGKCKGLHDVEGWFLSFHYADANANPTCPPDLMAGDVPTVTGLYFCPANAVQIIDTGIVDCFQERVFQYEVQLADCCLVCSLPDPRLAGALPAAPDAFNETADFRYWLDIQAVVGATFIPDGAGGCVKRITNTLPSDQVATGDFWGWHTSPAVTQPQGPLNEACAGEILLLPPMPPYCPDYGNWAKQPWLCPVLPPPPVNMAFELLTPSAGCVCPCDMNGDGVKNGLDIMPFIRCLLGVPLPADLCPCGDFDGDGVVTLLDIAPFVNCILSGPAC